MDAWDGKGHLHDLLLSDPDLPLDAPAVEACFDLARITETSAVVFREAGRAGLNSPVHCACSAALGGNLHTQHGGVEVSPSRRLRVPM